MPASGPPASAQARDGLSSITRGTLLMLLGTLGLVGFTFVSRVILVRAMSVAAWGTFSLGLTIVSLATAVAVLGFPQAVARNLAFVTDPAERRAVIRNSFLFVLPSAVAGSVFLFVLGGVVASVYHDAQLGLTLEYFSAVVGLGVAATLIAAIFQGFEDAWPNAVFVQLLNPLLFIVFLVAALVVLPASERYAGALGTYVLSDVAILVPLLVYMHRRLGKLLPPGPVRPHTAVRLLSFALPLLVVGVLSSVSGSADTLILGIIHRGEVGLYTATLSLARLLGLGLSSLGYIFLPVAARFLGRRDQASLRLTYATATKWTLLVSLPLFLVFFFFPSQSLDFVFGSAYSANVLPLRIVVTGGLLASLFGPASAAQIAFGQTRLVLYNTLLAAAADVGLSFVLIPSHGQVGAAVAWSVSTVSYPLLSTAELAWLEGLHPFERHYLVPLGVTLIPVALLFGLLPLGVADWELPAITIGLAVLYVVVVLVSRSVDTGDLLMLEVVEQFLGRPLRFLRRVGRLLAGPVPAR